MGEAWGADVERAGLYSAPDGSERSMVFQFEHICLDQQPGKEKWDLAPLPLVSLKQCFAHWQQGLFGRGWNSLFLNNHDLSRIVSRWGDDTVYRVESAKMLATMQKLIALRKAFPVFRDGRFTLLLSESEEIFAYTRDTDREHLLVVCNFTPGCVPFARPEAFRQAELLISNDSEPTCVLRPYEAQMFYREASGPEKEQAREA